jgi:hypothetical protein
MGVTPPVLILSRSCSERGLFSCDFLEEEMLHVFGMKRGEVLRRFSWAISDAEIDDRAAFLGRKKRFRTLIIWNRDRGQLSKASHYQVTAEGGVAPLGRGSAFSQIQFRFRVLEGDILPNSRS